MTQSFVPAPDQDRHPVNVDATDDVDELNPEGVYATAAPLTEYAHGTEGTDHFSVTGGPYDADTYLTAQPGEFYTRRVPRMPRVGRTLTRTVNVFGDGVHRPLIGRNMNRCGLTMWTDQNNTAPIFVSVRDQDSGVGFAPGSLPFTFETFYEFTVWSSAAGILYIVEADYYTSEDDHR